jgi:23S rRNA pseudouridine1911/1915/1917 synthase
VLERAVRSVPRTESPTSQLQPNSFVWKEQMVKTYGIQVLYDNDELAILNKPSGMKLFECANPTRRVTKAAAPSLEALLLKQGMELSSLNQDRSRGFVHRLDVGTSGCLVLAKTNSMHAQLISKFFLRQVQKSYIALVSTTTPCTGGYRRVPDAGTVNLAIDRRPAQSSFQTLERYGSLAAKLREITRQGRKHQVRLHCSKGLQTPILLDPL